MLNFFKELRGSVPRQSRQLPTSGNILMET
jgi:hypothetical protein